MLAAPAGYGDALLRTGREVAYADFLSEGELVTSGIPLVGWSVEANAGQWIRRSGSITVPAGALPLTGVFGAEVRLSVGPDENHLVPIGTLGVRDISQSYPREPMKVTLADRCQRVSDDRFPIPRTLGGGSVVDTIRALLRESAPWADLVVDGVADGPCAEATYSRDRDTALKSLAAVLGAQVWCDPIGDFRLTPIPDPDGDAVYTVADGDGRGLVGGSVAVSRSGVYNAVLAYSTGQVPVYGTLLADGVTPTASDLDLYSPTYVFGPFGRVTRFLPSPFFADSQQCDLSGLAFLRKTRALARSLEFTAVTDARLEPDDMASVDFGDGPQRQLVQSISFSSLSPMKVTSRSGVVTEGE